MTDDVGTICATSSPGTRRSRRTVCAGAYAPTRTPRSTTWSTGRTSRRICCWTRGTCSASRMRRPEHCSTAPHSWPALRSNRSRP